MIINAGELIIGFLLFICLQLLNRTFCLLADDPPVVMRSRADRQKPQRPWSLSAVPAEDPAASGAASASPYALVAPLLTASETALHQLAARGPKPLMCTVSTQKNLLSPSMDMLVIVFISAIFQLFFCFQFLAFFKYFLQYFFSCFSFFLVFILSLFSFSFQHVFYFYCIF